ncbi:MAG: LamG domain-containing protein [Planctomycetes bacterium]|nr:LamG domain-containing protein [Planctomycetota bacterium]
MCKNLIYLVSLVLLLSFALTDTTKAELVGWWRFDEGSGTIATDSSGHDMHGVLVSDPEWRQDGVHDECLFFDGDQAHVRITNQDSLNPAAGSFTIAFWAYLEPTPGTQGSTNWDLAVNKRDSGSVGYYVGADRNQGNADQSGYRFMLGDTGANRKDTAFVTVPLEEWVFVAAVLDRDQNAQKISVDGGKTWDTTTPPPGPIAPVQDLGLGWDIGIGNYWFHGRIDDVRVYNHALIDAEILAAMEGGEGYPYALGPNPSDGTLHLDTWVSISWIAGDYAVSHDVYLGDNFNNVNSGAEGTFQGNQAGTDFVAGFPGFPYPDGLIPGTTYYWRVDEVNDTEPNSPWKGKIWSFSIPPKTAYFPDPADGAESVDADVQLSWTAGFGGKLHTVYFGETFEEVDNAAGGLPQGTTTFTPGTLKMAKTYYWRVDEFDIVETHKGDVWSFTTEGAVVVLDPANGAVDVTQTPVLTWAPGLGASHEIYFGTDSTSLELKSSGNLGSESFESGQLEWNTTYYWRIDEANNVNADSPWTGPLWSFTTANFLIVDDFEAYNDLDPADPASNRIFNVWLDGFDNPAINGSVVGNANPPFAEQIIVHSGNQSMPFAFDNAVGTSEATLTLAANRDWTVNGVNRLTIWYRGTSSNVAEQMYVVLNGSAAVNHDNPDAALAAGWNEWNIDLQAFADQGVNLTSVTSITLGLGNRANPVAGGSGMMYFDDIRLYPPEP